MKPTLSTTALFAVFGLSRHLDGLIRIFLRQSTGESFLPALARNLRWEEAGVEVLNVLGFGLSLWLALAMILAWLRPPALQDLLARAARPFIPLLLPVALSAVGALSLILSPRFPYGLNFPLTLAYEGTFAVVVVWSLVGASVVRMLLDALGPLPSPPLSPRAYPWVARGAAAILVVLSMVVFTWVTPSRFWKQGEGQGNMFKYIRIAAALARSGSLDIRQAGGRSDKATARGFLGHLPRMARVYSLEASDLVTNFFAEGREGRLYVGKLEATRANRSMFRSAEGGIYYINAPGPGMLLVPAYLADQFLNRWRGEARQVTVILFWAFLGALLVLQMARAAREVAGTWPPAVTTAVALALSPPFLFYTFQIYPELPAALGLLYAFRKFILDPAPRGRDVFLAAVAVAFLPWLHQKYSMAAAVLGGMAAWRFLARGEGLYRLGRLVLVAGPLAVSAFSILVYNHALTGSVLPDATFRAAGRASFAPQNVPRGLLGLLLDGENGLFVYAPVYLLTLWGMGTFFLRHRKLYYPWLAILVSYLVVIASFPYWPGAVSTVARYILSAAPLAVLPMVLVVRRSFSNGVLAGVGLTLFAASVSFSLSFMKDLVPSYQPRLLLGRSLYSDPSQYLPSFLNDGVLGSGPAHIPKLVVIAAVLTLLVSWLSPRVRREPALVERGARLYPWHATLGAAGILGLVVLTTAFLERFPSNRTEKTGPQYRDTRPLARGSEIELAVEGRFGFEGRGVWVPGGGTTHFLVQSPRPLRRLRLALSDGPRKTRVEVTQRRAPRLSVELEPSRSRALWLPLRAPYVFHGPAGGRWIYRFAVRSREGFTPRDEGRGEDARYLGCFVTVSAL